MFEIKLSIVTVAQHLVGPIITCDYNETATIDVKGIVSVGIAFSRGCLCVSQFDVGKRW